MVAAAIVGAAVVGGAATVYGASQAASAQESAAAQANATEKGFFNTSQEALNPFIQQGQEATKQIAGLEGLPQFDASGNPLPVDPSGIQNTLNTLPGYQFALTQGLKSTQNTATARGLGVSGAAAKGAASYATGLAESNYSNYLTGIQNTANTGAGAGGALAGVATGVGGSISNNLVGAGNAAAAASNSAGSAAGNLANSIPSALITSALLQGRNNQNNYYNYSQNPEYNPGTFDVGASSNGLPWSDIALKENIALVGREKGHNIYEFNYLWSPVRFRGVMAQEVMKKLPAAVRKIGDYLAVDYSKIGVEFRRIG